jgi:hypothetical protein
MAPDFLTQANGRTDDAHTVAADKRSNNLSEAEKALQELADVFLPQQSLISRTSFDLTGGAESSPTAEPPLLSMEAKYRALVEQIPAVVFMAYLDKGIGEAYVSPQIEICSRFFSE